jgi:hypothetical protein
MGIDTAGFSGLRSNCTITKSGSSNYVVTDTRGGTPDGVDVVTNTELFGFSNVRLSAENFTPVSLNGDVRSDLVWTSTSGGSAAYLMDGANITSAVAVGGANGAEWRVKAVGDLNGDAASDLIWQDTNGNAAAYLMNGTGINIAIALGNFTTSFRVVGTGDLIGAANGADVEVRRTADLNGDGKMDLIWQNTVNGQAVAFLMDGLTITSAGALGGSNGVEWFVV